MSLEISKETSSIIHYAPATMKAAVVEAYKAPLKIMEVPKPVAGPGEIVVKIIAAGLCHTDIHAAHGDWPVKSKLLDSRPRRGWHCGEPGSGCNQPQCWRYGGYSLVRLCLRGM